MRKAAGLFIVFLFVIGIATIVPGRMEVGAIGSHLAPAPNDERLKGTYWRLESLYNRSIRPNMIRVQFNRGVMSGTAPCNLWARMSTETGRTFSLLLGQKDLSSCRQPHAQDATNRLKTAMKETRGTAYDADSGLLAFLDKDRQKTATFRQIKAPSLIGKRWRIAAYRVKESMSPLLAGTKATVIFEDGHLTLKTGCSPAIGDYADKSGKLSIKLDSGQSSACPSSDHARQHVALSESLNDGISWQRKGMDILLKDRTGKMILRLVD